MLEQFKQIYTHLPDNEPSNYIKRKVKQLRKKLKHWNKEYHINDAPSVLDATYDHEYHHLKALEEKYPQLITDDSPTQTVGSIDMK